MFPSFLPFTVLFWVNFFDNQISISNRLFLAILSLLFYSIRFFFFWKNFKLIPSFYCPIPIAFPLFITLSLPLSLSSLSSLSLLSLFFFFPVNWYYFHLISTFNSVITYVTKFRNFFTFLLLNIDEFFSWEIVNDSAIASELRFKKGIMKCYVMWCKEKKMQETHKI